MRISSVLLTCLFIFSSATFAGPRFDKFYVEWQNTVGARILQALAMQVVSGERREQMTVGELAVATEIPIRQLNGILYRNDSSIAPAEAAKIAQVLKSNAQWLMAFDMIQTAARGHIVVLRNIDQQDYPIFYSIAQRALNTSEPDVEAAYLASCRPLLANISDQALQMELARRGLPGGIRLRFPVK